MAENELTKNEDINDVKNIDFAYEITSKKLEMQNNAHNSLEAKIGTLLAFVGAIIASSIALLINKTDLLGLNIFTIGFIGVFISLVFLIIASHTRTYLNPPEFLNYYSNGALLMKNMDLKNHVVADMVESYKINDKHHGIKATFYNLAIYGFALSLLFLFIGILE